MEIVQKKNKKIKLGPGIQNLVEKQELEKYFNKSQLQLFQKPDKENCFEEEYNGQSYSEFLNMESQPNENYIDVFSMFDIFVEYLKEKDYALVIFIDHEISEYGRINEITGRACGDGIAVINCQNEQIITGQNSDLKHIYTTALHEFLHTFGYDHCVYYDCLMNAGYDTDNSQLQLCPIDFLKLQSEVRLNDKQILERYVNLLNFSIKYNWESDVIWLKRMIQLLKND
ncbi:hypothetical protein PPERSA_01232 [Pseudocohnilembus persalinus]|uniref:Uncharacterized protein n=1 Tax=Pseudocohnilembus persalinus TaxID=266149 RepID=A0A0V0R982_PSEPJ|nr:hypothetical protein PPERSA_01232 [Pseudocohnilembus persalinus]|eukprot:KRX11033.1 hypothetical protein PPERSA_01232 [Pseudocohnilembus persalinus]